MKIAFLIDHMSSGGAQRVISLLSSRFVEKGHSVTIVIRCDNPDIAYPLDPSIRVVFLPKEELPLPKPTLWEKAMDFLSAHSDTVEDLRMRHGIEERKNAGYVLSYFQKNPVDIVFAFLIKSNIAAALCAKKTPAKIVIAERIYPGLPLASHIKYLRDHTYKKADVCVFQTEEQKLAFSRAVQRKAVVIPNPVKGDLPEPFTGKRNHTIVNYCGYKNHKNIPLLIDAFVKISAKYPEYRLDLYGYGEYKDQLQERVNALGLSEKIRLRPFEADIHSLVLQDAMFVMSSDYEGMPNALIEAMAIGLPSISTDCLGGGAKALIKNHENGILTPIGDVDALADAMAFYIEHPEKAAEYAQNALSVKEDLSLDKIAERWLALCP